MVKLGEAGLIDKIKMIGLYRSKARNLIALSKALVEQHESKVPDNREALEALPASGARPPMSCSTSPLARARSPSTRMLSGLRTAPGSRPVRPVGGGAYPQPDRAGALQA
jgi:hypothetical protein